MLADGVNNTGVGLARAVVSFSPETVQEFSIQSSAYSAEFGTTGGGVINITTKSGAKDFFGTALWYHRNPKTNARAWNQGSAPRPANNLRSNQLSFTVGGPVIPAEPRRRRSVRLRRPQAWLFLLLRSGAALEE